MSTNGKTSKRDELLIAISVSLGALFIATVATLVIARYYKKLRGCCTKYFACLLKGEDKEDDDNVTAIEMRRRAMRGASIADPKVPFMLTSRDKQQFVIPGQLVQEKVQPDFTVDESSLIRSICEYQYKSDQDVTTDKSKARREWSSAKKNRKLLRTISNIEGPSNEKDLASYYNKEAANPLRRRDALDLSDPTLLTVSRDDLDNDTSLNNGTQEGSHLTINTTPVTKYFHEHEEYSDDNTCDFPIEKEKTKTLLRPELYDKTRKKSVGIGTLGKITISLQFLDREKYKLELLLSRVNNLILENRGFLIIYVGIMMLPDRETMYRSDNQSAVPSTEFKQVFLFTRTQTSETFQTKSLRFFIYATNVNNRQEMYGESQIQLSGNEIYSNIRTNFVLNINPPSQLTEIGDMLMEIVYTARHRLYVVVKAMKIAATTSLDTFSDLRVKCYLKGNRRKLKAPAAVIIPMTKTMQLDIPINIEIEQEIPKRSVASHSIHIVVSGKLKFVGKKQKIGKCIIGNNALHQTEISNWNSIIDQVDNTSNIWHVLYAY